MDFERCNKCTNKPLARGLKIFKCLSCEEDGNNNFFGIEKCDNCIKKEKICYLCGEKLDKE